MKDTRFRAVEYLAVIAIVIAITLLKTHIPFFEQLLVAALYLLLIVCAALFGDYIAGTLSVVLSGVAVDYDMAPYGIKFDKLAAYRTLEILLVGAIVCLLAWRSRSLEKDNHLLISTAEELKTIVTSLQSETKNKSKEMERLTTINEDLDELVKQFLDDDEYWFRRKTSVKSKNL